MVSITDQIASSVTDSTETCKKIPMPIARRNQRDVGVISQSTHKLDGFCQRGRGRENLGMRQNPQSTTQNKL